MELFQNLALGFQTSLTAGNLLFCLIGVSLGTAIGVLPGLGPVGTIAILLPITYKMDLTSAIIMLGGVYYGSQYGGTITSVLVNIPGEAASVVTCLEGYPMARKGRGGAALGVAAIGSFIGGTVGIIGVSMIAPPLSRIALAMGPVEYTALLFLGLSLVIYLTTQSVLKGLIMAVLGFLLGTIGMDPVSGVDRFLFGTQTLVEGLNLAPLAMGIFGLGEILSIAERKNSAQVLKMSTRMKDLLPNRQEWKDSGPPIMRGTVLGFLLGCLPGGGAIVASFLIYGLEKRISKHPERFGKGAIEGVAGPETANNAASSGAFVPLLTLGIPANVVMALLVGAFMLHGVIPGPLIIKEKPDLFWGIVTSMYIGNVMLLILNLPLIGIFVQILRVRQQILNPLIILFCFIGTYSINANFVDVVLMIVFGIFGYFMRKYRFEPGPLLLAFVLGPLFERALRKALIISNGSPAIFFTRPVAGILMAIALFLYIRPLVGLAINSRKRSAAAEEAVIRGNKP